MKIRTRGGGRLVAATVIGAAAIALPTSAMAVSAGHNPPARHRIAPCRAGGTQIWLGLGPGGGAAGTTFYPLEFSNVGRRTCTLFGFPGVSAVINGRQVGGAAIRIGRKHLVVLHPGQTAHAILGIVEAGNIARCHIRNGASLKVFAPNQQAFTVIPAFAFTACSNRSVLRIQSVRSGVGIPGFTTS
jgi:hypothetical protein